MKIYIGSDHAGFELKEKLIPFLKELGHEVENIGAFEHDKNDDYPDFIRPVAEAVAQDEQAKGIVIGKSGQGEAMCAHKVKGIRAAVFYGGSTDIIKLSREHNDANILSLGAGFINEYASKEALKVWLATPFSGDERHIRRLAKLEKSNE